MIVTSFLNIADFDVRVTFHTITKEGKHLRYDFENRKWNEDTKITMDTLKPVRDLVYNVGLKKKFSRKTVVNWGTIKSESLSHINERLERPYILNIEIKV